MARMNRPAPVEITYKNMRFLITHNPTNATLNKFIEVSMWFYVQLLSKTLKEDKNQKTKVLRENTVTLNRIAYHQENLLYGITVLNIAMTI